MKGVVRGIAQALTWAATIVVLLPAQVLAQQAIPDCERPGAVCAPALVEEPGPPTRRLERLEFSVLGGVFSGAEIGETPATVLINEVPTSGETALFKTRTSLTTAPVLEGRLGVRVVGSLWVEGGMSYASPELAVDISDDVEGAPAVTATSQLTQLTFDGGVQYRWNGRRVSPFVMGGAGYLRQLDEPRTTVETGSLFYGGGGARVRLTTAQSGWLSHVALRGDARVVWLRGGIRLVDERAPALTVTGGLSLAF